ncbi:MAG: ubiquitin-like small modifier protein 1 [Anaerolineales bacterium]
MRINFYATLREIVGGKTIELSLQDGMTIQTLLDALFERYPRLRQELMDEQGNLYPHVHVFVNGRDAPFLESGLQTPISEQDVISIFPAVGGG